MYKINNLRNKIKEGVNNIPGIGKVLTTDITKKGLEKSIVYLTVLGSTLMPIVSNASVVSLGALNNNNDYPYNFSRVKKNYTYSITENKEEMVTKICEDDKCISYDNYPEMDNKIIIETRPSLQNGGIYDNNGEFITKYIVNGKKGNLIDDEVLEEAKFCLSIVKTVIETEYLNSINEIRGSTVNLLDNTINNLSEDSIKQAK